MKKIMKRVALVCISLTTLMAFTGCSAPTSGTATTVDQTKTITDLTKKVNDLEARAKTDDIVAQTKGRDLDLSGNSGFMKIETDLGMFFVSVKHVEPYLDGVQVTLSIGNPMNATYNGLKMKIEYGTYHAMDFSTTGTEKYDLWKKTLKKKAIDINTEIKPGTWNTVILTIPAISPKDFGYLNVEINSDAVSLLQP